MNPFETTIEEADIIEERAAHTLDGIDLEEVGPNALDSSDTVIVNVPARFAEASPAQITLSATEQRQQIYSLIGEPTGFTNRLGVLNLNPYFENLLSKKIGGIQVDVFGYKPSPLSYNFVGSCKVVLTFGGESVEHDIEDLEELSMRVPNALAHSLQNDLSTTFAYWKEKKFVNRRFK